MPKSKKTASATSRYLYYFGGALLALVLGYFGWNYYESLTDSAVPATINEVGAVTCPSGCYDGKAYSYSKAKSKCVLKKSGGCAQNRFTDSDNTSPAARGTTDKNDCESNGLYWNNATKICEINPTTAKQQCDKKPCVGKNGWTYVQGKGCVAKYSAACAKDNNERESQCLNRSTGSDTQPTEWQWDEVNGRCNAINPDAPDNAE